MPFRAPDQNLVPEPEDEMEEGPQAAEHQGPLRVKQHKLPRCDWFSKLHRTPIAAFDSLYDLCQPSPPFLSLIPRLNDETAAMVRTTRDCTLDRNSAFASEERMDCTAVSLVLIRANTTHYMIWGWGRGIFHS